VSSFNALEEALERPVQTPDRGPLAVKGPAPVPFRVIGPDLLQLRVLAAERDLVAAHPPCLAPLFKRRVVELAGVLKACAKCGLLSAGWP